MHFDVSGISNKSTRERTLFKLLKSPGLMLSASSSSNTIFLPTDPDEFCDRLKLLLKEKQPRNMSDLKNEEVVVLLDKLLEYKCMSKKQHKQIFIECDLLHTKKK